MSQEHFKYQKMWFNYLHSNLIGFSLTFPEYRAQIQLAKNELEKAKIVNPGLLLREFYDLMLPVYQKILDKDPSIFDDLPNNKFIDMIQDIYKQDDIAPEHIDRVWELLRKLFEWSELYINLK